MRALLMTSIVALALASGFSATVEAQGERVEDIRAYLEISDRLSTGGQVTYEQIPALADAGVEVVVNLAIADDDRNGREGFLVVEQGMTYIHIPVDFGAPSQEHLQQFFEVMDANRERKVFVHCFANMRVSAFTYLYRTLQLSESDAAARADMVKIWDPFTNERFPQWRTFIEAARNR